MAAIQPRPQPNHPTADSWTELDEYLLMRISDFSEDLDGEEAQHIGWDAQQRSRACLAMLSEIRMVIREAVADEQVREAFTSQEDRIDQLAKLSGADEEWERLRESGADELTLRRLDGDR